MKRISFFKRTKTRRSAKTVRKINDLLRRGFSQEARDQFSNSPPEDELASEADTALETKDQALALLGQADRPDAAELWNAWREKTATRTESEVIYQEIDLSGENFSRFPFPELSHETPAGTFTLKTISGYNFNEIRLTGCSFRDMALHQLRINGNMDLDACKFERSLILSCRFEGIWFDDSEFENAVLVNSQFFHCDAWWTSFQNTEIHDCIFGGFDVRKGHFKNTAFRSCTLVPYKHELDEKERLTKATAIRFSKLTNVTFGNGTQFEDVEFDYSVINKVNFSGSFFSGSSFKRVLYKRRLLVGCFSDVEGIESISGDRYFRNDAIDQEYFDSVNDNNDRKYAFKQATKEKSGRHRPVLNSYTLDNIVSQADRYLDIFGIFCGLISGAMIFLSIFDFNIITVCKNLDTGAIILGFCAITFSLMMGAIGKKITYALWRMLDYGRDWDRILGLGLVIIAGMGTVYFFASQHDICYVASPIAPTNGLCEPSQDGAVHHPLNIYPWFVALMGFTTLGVADYIEPKTALGAMIMALNAFAGYAVLGLFLAVMQASFLRRSPTTGA